VTRTKKINSSKNASCRKQIARPQVQSILVLVLSIGIKVECGAIVSRGISCPTPEYDTIRYDTIEFNVDSKAQYSAYLAHVARKRN